MLRTRIITALVLLGPVLAALAWWPTDQGHWFFAPIIGLVMWEWTRLAGVTSAWLRVGAGFAIGAALILLPNALRPMPDVAAFGFATGVLWVGGFIWLTQPAAGANGGPAWLLIKLIMGAAVCLLTGWALVWLFHLPMGRLWTLALLLVIWGADVGAYFTGKAFGRHKLAPRISPGKTWQGVFGGLILAAVLAAIMSFYLPRSPWSLALVALVTAAVSIVGDLLASLLKRQQNLKDSSQLLPGHGGVVDRLDSLLAAAPVFSLGVAITA